MKKFLLITIALVLFVSCDCYRVVKGVVIDNTTKSPIQNVLVYNKNNKNVETRTDENGYFKLGDNSSGGIYECPPMIVIIEHHNYNKIETKIKAGSQKKIFLIKNQKNSN